MTTAHVLQRLNGDVKLGELKRLAREIKRDHDLALALWATGSYHPRMLAVLILDRQRIDQALVDRLTADLDVHSEDEQTRVMEWLMANQLAKAKPTIALMESWRQSASPLQRRTYWYYQGRKRWTGQASPPDTAELLGVLESDLAEEVPMVQWAMNFLAGWIGVFDPAFRARCVALGERIGLYRGDPVPRGCTPAYLPEFIAVEVGKRA